MLYLWNDQLLLNIVNILIGKGGKVAMVGASDTDSLASGIEMLPVEKEL